MEIRVSKAIVEGQITAFRPAVIVVLAWWTGLSAVIGFFVAPFYIPWNWGPFGTPSYAAGVTVAVSFACSAAVITYGLLRGRLWAWFSAWSAAVGMLLLRGLWIADRLGGGGFGLVDLVLSSFPGLWVTALGVVVPLILASARTRRWFFLARRLRSMTPERLEVYMQKEPLPLGLFD